MGVSVIIPAAGLSKRMKGFDKRKPFILLDKRPVLCHTLNIFKKISAVKEIILVVNKKDLNIARKYFSGIATKIVTGGQARVDSVFNGVTISDKRNNIILIHDAVRPFVTKDIVLNSIKAAVKFGAAVVAVPVVPTIKRADENGFVNATLNRKLLWEIQTPQVFKRDIIVEAFEKSANRDETITDDAMLVEKLGVKVKLVMGSYRNIKITTPDDLIIAKRFMDKKGLICA